MAIGANSYGDTTEVGTFMNRYANDAALFDATTLPTLTQVESMVDQVSAMLNGILRQYGFTTPVTNADAKLALDAFVNEQVSVLVEAVNVRGRYGPGSDQPYEAVDMTTILQKARDYIAGMAVGLERLGATRSSDPMAGISYRNVDEGGDDVSPIFQRDGFGNRFKDWDS